MQKNIFSVLFAVFLLFNQKCLANDGSRLYIDFYRTQAQKTMALISKVEVQKDLKLTTNQLTEIENFRHKPQEDIPALTNLLAQARIADKTNRIRIFEEISEQIDEYLFNTLTNIITTEQSKRLQQIMWQVDGLKSLDKDSQLVAKIGLSDEQVGEVKDVFAFYEPILDPLHRLLQRKMIAGLSANETMQGRQEDVESLAGAITVIEKERDDDLLTVLTPTQRNKWHRLTGKPINIHWELELF